MEPLQNTINWELFHKHVKCCGSNPSIHCSECMGGSACIYALGTEGVLTFLLFFFPKQEFSKLQQLAVDLNL